MKILIACLALVNLGYMQISYGQNWTEERNGTVAMVSNIGGKTLGYSTNSGVKILTVDGLAFKELNRNNTKNCFLHLAFEWLLSSGCVTHLCCIFS